MNGGPISNAAPGLGGYYDWMRNLHTDPGRFQYRMRKPGEVETDYLAGLNPAKAAHMAKVKQYQEFAKRLEGAEDMNTAMGMMALAGPLLQAAGPTPQPVSFAQAAGAGLPQMMQIMRQGPRNFLADEAAMMKLRGAKTAAAEATATKKMLAEYRAANPQYKGIPDTVLMEIMKEDAKGDGTWKASTLTSPSSKQVVGPGNEVEVPGQSRDVMAYYPKSPSRRIRYASEGGRTVPVPPGASVAPKGKDQANYGEAKLYNYMEKGDNGELIRREVTARMPKVAGKPPIGTDGQPISLPPGQKLQASGAFEKKYTRVKAAKESYNKLSANTHEISQGMARVETLYRPGYFDMTDEEILSMLNGEEQREVLDFMKMAERENIEVQGVADIAILVAFMKAIDPGSVVREGEFNMAQASQAVKSRAKNFFQQIMTGQKLTRGVRREFMRGIYNLYSGQMLAQAQVDKEAEKMAKFGGYDADLVVRDFYRPKFLYPARLDPVPKNTKAGEQDAIYDRYGRGDFGKVGSDAAIEALRQGLNAIERKYN